MKAILSVFILVGFSSLVFAQGTDTPAAAPAAPAATQIETPAPAPKTQHIVKKNYKKKKKKHGGHHAHR